MAYCYSNLQVCYTRVAALTAAGDADPGANKGYVTDALIEATIGLEIEEGVEILKKNACGTFCVNFRDFDRIKRSTVEMTLCKLEFELIDLLIGADIFTSGGNTTGFKIPAFDDPAPNGVCLEFWARAWNGDQQATISSTNAWHHFVIPRAKLTLGDLALGESTDIVVTGFGNSNSALNIDGPYNDWAQGVPQGGGIDTPLGVFIDTSVPTVQCGYTTVPAQGS